ncbi:hypothetical protein INT45_007050 [Circinella minor]|uniref:Uncharacterized protein n=1 Tax=Circinella minor TaxID=1195481 RepID=A0A8H7SAV0_9FUNG|nr:hypothetical protein INT45_007050 [Circinella minor]
MDHFFESVAARMGDQISGDHLKLVICVITSLPLAVVYRTLPPKSPTIRHLFSIFHAITTMVFVLKFYTDALHIGLTGLFTYVFMKYYRGKRIAYINFIFVMISLSICHLDRKINGLEGSSKLDYSAPLMVAIIKFSSFGFNVTDGRKTATSGTTTINAYNERMKIAKYPSLIEYFGWICFFGGFFMVGPTSEYMDYYRFTNTFSFSKEKYMSPYIPALRHIIVGIGSAAIVVLVGDKFSYTRMLEDSFLNLQ